MKKTIFILFLLTSLYFTVKMFSFAFNDNEDNNFQNNFMDGYKVFALNIPQDMGFAGEKVPVGNFDVRESLDKELLQNVYYQSNTVLLYKRANRWFPVIAPILKKHGIPDDFKYIALIESNLTNIISPAGATGFWQIIETTAKLHGLEISQEVDERYDVEKSTEAACKYFLEAYDNLKNWTLVAASYNMGIAGIKRQLDAQKVNSYYDLLLNQETARYVFRILAIKEIFSHPRKYGYHIRKKDLYPVIPTYKVELKESVESLADWALAHEVNYKILKIFNPWLRKTMLNNKDNKSYFITLPKAGYTEMSQLVGYGETNELIGDSLFNQWKGDTIQ